MKFINYLEKIIGVDVYGIASFLIFFVFFIVMALWAFRADNKLIKKLSEMPFSDQQEQDIKN